MSLGRLITFTEFKWSAYVPVVPTAYQTMELELYWIHSRHSGPTERLNLSRKHRPLQEAKGRTLMVPTVTVGVPASLHRSCCLAHCTASSCGGWKEHCESRLLLNPELFMQSSILDPTACLLPPAWWDLRGVCFSGLPPGTSPLPQQLQIQLTSGCGTVVRSWKKLFPPFPQPVTPSSIPPTPMDTILSWDSGCCITIIC